jgi:hypothetical protein
VEGDGSFSYKNLSKSAFFTIGQKGNKCLLLSIKDYLYKLGIAAQAKATIKDPELVACLFFFIIFILLYNKKIVYSLLREFT